MIKYIDEYKPQKNMNLKWIGVTKLMGKKQVCSDQCEPNVLSSPLLRRVIYLYKANADTLAG